MLALPRRGAADAPGLDWALDLTVCDRLCGRAMLAGIGRSTASAAQDMAAGAASCARCGSGGLVVFVLVTPRCERDADAKASASFHPGRRRRRIQWPSRRALDRRGVVLPLMEENSSGASSCALGCRGQDAQFERVRTRSGSGPAPICSHFRFSTGATPCGWPPPSPGWICVWLYRRTGACGRCRLPVDLRMQVNQRRALRVGVLC